MTGASSFTADLVLACDSDEDALALAGALGVEAGMDLPRASSVVSRDARDVRIAIAARDAVSLRAAVNSYLRWARVALDAARAGGARGAPA